MNICKLCQEKDADKKGSHVVPFFLIRDVENIDGKKERYYEIGFSLGGSAVKAHFGSSILPERLEETFGEIQDQDIEENSHPMIIDHLLCTLCEKRLSVLESKYSRFLSNDSEEVAIDSNFSYLFWISVFWRLSVVDNNEIHLSDDLCEYFRDLLDRSLTEVEVNLDVVNQAFKFYLLKVADIDEGTFTYPFFSDGVIGLVVGGCISLIVIDDRHNEIENSVLREIVNYLDHAKINEKGSNKENRIIISNSQYQSIKNAILESYVKNFQENLLNELDEQVKMFIPNIDSELLDILKKDIFINLIYDEDIPVGRKYTIENKMKCIQNSFRKHGLINYNE